MSAFLRLALMGWMNANLISRATDAAERYAKGGALFVVAFFLALLMLGFAGLALGLWLSPKVGAVGAAGIVAGVFLVLTAVAAIAGKMVMRKPSAPRSSGVPGPAALPAMIPPDAVPRIQHFARAHMTELVLAAVIAGMMLNQRRSPRN